MHPRTQRLIAPEVKDWCANIIFIDPLGYLDFLTHLANAQMILTDSGGIQKEAYILKKPCVTLRTETEWVETVISGWNLLLDPSDAGFPEMIRNFKAPEEHPDLFGVDVSKKIVEALEA